MNYRERIKNVREDRDLTQAQIRKILNKSQQGYNHIETGRAELKIDDLALVRLQKELLLIISKIISKGASKIFG